MKNTFFAILLLTFATNLFAGEKRWICNPLLQNGKREIIYMTVEKSIVPFSKTKMTIEIPSDGWSRTAKVIEEVSTKLGKLLIMDENKEDPGLFPYLIIGKSGKEATIGFSQGFDGSRESIAALLILANKPNCELE